MSELQSSDFVIPAFLLMAEPHPETKGSSSQIDDFLKHVQGWSEVLPQEELE